MTTVVKCKECGSTDFSLSRYESLLALSSDLAVFALRCPNCGAAVTAVCTIPPCLRNEVEDAASKLGAGMGGKRPAGR